MPEPRTGETLTNNPVPEPPPPPDLGRAIEPRTGTTQIAHPIPAPPESKRLAGRLFAPSPLPPEQSARWVGGYQVLSRLQRAKTGSEYLCRPADDPQARYTLAVLRNHLGAPGASDAFLRYANRLAKITHPFVLGLVDAGVHHHQPYLVRPRLEAVTFAQLLATTPPSDRSPRLMLRIFEEALEGLVAAHEPREFSGESIQFVHGALSAEHLLVTTRGRTLVSSVGEATILGATVDPSQDLLALGILINAALAGGMGEDELRLRWLADARTGRAARAGDLLREFRRITSQDRLHVRSEEIAEWVQSVRRLPPDRASTPSPRESFPSLAPEPPPAHRSGWLAPIRSWWGRRTRRF
jgi:hypothetical protein